MEIGKLSIGVLMVACFRPSEFESILALRSLALANDLTCFMKVFDLVRTWYVFVCNDIFNATMFRA